MKTYFTYDEARAAAKPGDEIWARDSAKVKDKTGWTVMSTELANEYVRDVPSWFRDWTHWETVK
jgi:hypothetical protein